MFPTPVPHQFLRAYSTTIARLVKDSSSRTPTLTHLDRTGAAHMVRVSEKSSTVRIAMAAGQATFSNTQPRTLIAASLVKKGDVLATARIAGIMAAKRTSSLVPLCHPLNLTSVGVDVELIHNLQDETPDGKQDYGAVRVTSKVECVGPTGVEMEALTAVTAACLTVVDMCKAVDRVITIDKVRLVLKSGGKTGEWREEGFAEAGSDDSI